MTTASSSPLCAPTKLDYEEIWHKLPERKAKAEVVVVVAKAAEHKHRKSRGLIMPGTHEDDWFLLFLKQEPTLSSEARIKPRGLN